MRFLNTQADTKKKSSGTRNVQSGDHTDFYKQTKVSQTYLPKWSIENIYLSLWINFLVKLWPTVHMLHTQCPMDLDVPMSPWPRISTIALVSNEDTFTQIFIFVICTWTVDVGGCVKADQENT